MAEAIYCRIKFAFLLCLFFLPILLSMWNRHLDTQLDQVRYLPGPLARAWTDDPGEDGLEPSPIELADVSDPLPGEIP